MCETHDRFLTQRARVKWDIFDNTNDKRQKDKRQKTKRQTTNDKRQRDKRRKKNKQTSELPFKDSARRPQLSWGVLNTHGAHKSLSVQQQRNLKQNNTGGSSRGYPRCPIRLVKVLVGLESPASGPKGAAEGSRRLHARRLHAAAEPAAACGMCGMQESSGYWPLDAIAGVPETRSDRIQQRPLCHPCGR